MDKSKEPVRVFLADDHMLFRDTLKKVFDSESGFIIVGEASEGQETVRMAKDSAPDVLLLERQLPDLSCLDVLRLLSEAGIKPKIIILTAEIERDQIQLAFQSGIHGLVLKESSSQSLFSSIRAVMAGRYWIGGEGYSNLEQVFDKLGEDKPKAEKPKNFSLTPREMKVIASVVSGHTNKEIARQFSISEQTVKHHISNIFDKLGVFNRLELSLFVLHHNLIDDPENK